MTAGTLKVGNVNALGSASAVTTVASGAALDLNGFGIANANVKIAGTGNGMTTGAFINTGAGGLNVLNVEMTGNATIGTGATAGYTIGGTSGASLRGGNVQGQRIRLDRRYSQRNRHQNSRRHGSQKSERCLLERRHC